MTDPFKCGPLMCTHSGKECAGKLLALGDSILRNQDSGALRLLGIASGQCAINTFWSFCVVFFQHYAFQFVVIKNTLFAQF